MIIDYPNSFQTYKDKELQLILNPKYFYMANIDIQDHFISYLPSEETAVRLLKEISNKVAGGIEVPINIIFLLEYGTLQIIRDMPERKMFCFAFSKIFYKTLDRFRCVYDTKNISRRFRGGHELSLKTIMFYSHLKGVTYVRK